MGAKENLGALNSLLFVQLERLSNDDLAGETLKEEIARTQAITGVSSQIISNAHLMLKAAQFKDESMRPDNIPKLLGDSNG